MPGSVCSVLHGVYPNLKKRIMIWKGNLINVHDFGATLSADCSIILCAGQLLKMKKFLEKLQQVLFIIIFMKMILKFMKD